jgi:NADPH oxidase 5
MRACMEENGMKFSEDQVEDLTMALFEDADVEVRGAITFEALKAQLEKHDGLLENLTIRCVIFLVCCAFYDELPCIVLMLYV